MSAYYVLSLREGKFLRFDAETLPEAQKLMRKHGPAAATFVGTKCFGSLPGVPTRTLDSLILHARGGGKGECAFCDDEATGVVDGDPVCAKHWEMDPGDREDEPDVASDEGDEPEPEDDESEDEPALEDDATPVPTAKPVRGRARPEAPSARPSAPVTPKLPPPVTSRPKAPAEGRCGLIGCAAAIGLVRGDTHPELVGYCTRHRSKIVAASQRCGGDITLATRRIAALIRAGVEGQTDPRVIRKVYEDEGLLGPERAKTKRPPPPKRTVAPKPAPPRPAAQAPSAAPVAVAPAGLRESFERLLRDHELVETIGREVCVALAARVKGGAA